tara:strand:- start:1804 stop:1917 length:114 start_codon:yes stop_codon:yes gene_type:complete
MQRCAFSYRTDVYYIFALDGNFQSIQEVQMDHGESKN